MGELLCCAIECDKPAEFEIRGESNHPEDYTHACEDHVGYLLGTPAWMRVQNGTWTVLTLMPPPGIGCVHWFVPAAGGKRCEKCGLLAAAEGKET